MQYIESRVIMGKYIALGVIIIVVIIFILIGISISKSKKPVQYMSNVSKLPDVKDVKGYNKELGKVFIYFGLLLLPIMSPLIFAPEHSLGSIVSVLLIMPWVIGLIVICSMIENKYKEK